MRCRLLGWRAAERRATAPRFGGGVFRWDAEPQRPHTSTDGWQAGPRLESGGFVAKAMRILFLTTDLSYPPQDGRMLRTYNVLRGLAQRHSIHLVCFDQR